MTSGGRAGAAAGPGPEAAAALRPPPFLARPPAPAPPAANGWRPPRVPTTGEGSGRCRCVSNQQVTCLVESPTRQQPVKRCLVLPMVYLLLTTPFVINSTAVCKTQGDGSTSPLSSSHRRLPSHLSACRHFTDSSTSAPLAISASSNQNSSCCCSAPASPPAKYC